MNVSLSSLRQRLLAMRAWDSEGKSLDAKLNNAINQALDRLAGDVPEALIPDEEHVVLQKPQKSNAEYVKAFVACHPEDKRLLIFCDENGIPIDSTRSLTTWRPRCTGEWDGIMHIEVKDPAGRWHRRQCREFFYDTQNYGHERLDVQPFGVSVKVAVGDPSISFGGTVLTQASVDAANELTKKATAKFRAEYDYTQNGAASAQAVNKVVASYFEGEGTKGAAAFKTTSKKDAEDKLKIAQANGLDVAQVDQTFLKQFRARLRGKGLKFRAFDSYGGVTRSKSLPFANEPSYDVNVRSVSTNTVDFDVFDHDIVQLFKSNRVQLTALATGPDNENPAPPETQARPTPQKKFSAFRNYMVTLDRPWRNNIDGWGWVSRLVGTVIRNTLAQTQSLGTREIKVQSITEPMEFRIYQPEFFLRDDVTELHEPAVIYDDTQQQMWSIDTAGADRAGMRDYQGDTEGRPARMFRGRHFQLPAPTEAPRLNYTALTGLGWADKSMLAGLLSVSNGSHESLQQGTWSMCYTYVWGRRDKEWQQSPNITPDGHRGMSPEVQINWAHTQQISATSPLSPGPVTSLTGIYDPTWESAPSPVSTVFLDPESKFTQGAIQVNATNIDAMLGFSDPYKDRFGRSGLRLRFYVSHNAYGVAGAGSARGAMQNTETGNKFYLLCEAEPTFDELAGNPQAACQFFWRGSCLYDIERPLRHSTGYYAYKTYPVQDDRYELDLRVSRLPKKLIDDQDTPPIQRDAVSALIELSAYYVALLDGADQAGAQIHLDRYTELARRYRSRYANPAKIVEPTSIIGGTSYRSRNGLFGNYASLKQDS